MSAALIQRLRDHQSRQSCDSLTERECNVCTSLEGLSTDTGKPFWLQILGGMLNFLHLNDAEKDFLLGEILDELGGLDPKSVQLEEGLYVTFPVDEMPSPVVDALLMRILEEYLAVNESTVGITTENFG
ncbi:MAG: hypothetical protein JWO82_2868 [Akkermansiaceae bacterium]|nr:hypothetical protein [Akkermansiaceae bacterium]